MKDFKFIALIIFLAATPQLMLNAQTTSPSVETVLKRITLSDEKSVISVVSEKPSDISSFSAWEGKPSKFYVVPYWVKKGFEALPFRIELSKPGMSPLVLASSILIRAKSGNYAGVPWVADCLIDNDEIVTVVIDGVTIRIWAVKLATFESTWPKFRPGSWELLQKPYVYKPSNLTVKLSRLENGCVLMKLKFFGQDVEFEDTNETPLQFHITKGGADDYKKHDGTR